MDIARYLSIGSFMKVIRKPGFWLILALLVLITLPHYEESLKHPAFLTHATANLGLQRHAFERILYLAPIVWAGFLFSWRGGFVTSLATLACMLPRAVFISPYPMDSLFETSVVFIIGNVLTFSFASLRREREYRSQLETAHQELQKSEETYRQLFENAHDTIWLHDMEGKIIAANKSAQELTGYSEEELYTMNESDFLSNTSLNLVAQIRKKLLKKEPLEQPYELCLTKKDGTEAFVQLTSSLVLGEDGPAAFQHIARDVTEHKRMQENLRFYLSQATKAQEEERKRIAHELHDETVQALVVHARRLDALTSSDTELPEDIRLGLEGLRQEIDEIMQGVRRLSHDLRPAALDRLGLIPALDSLASDVSQFSGVTVNVSAIGSKRRFSEEVELVLFRIVQEALRNVWRHAKATRADVVVEFEKKRTRVTVSDNGKGFSLPKTVSELAREGKLGLVGMQERAQLIGASLLVRSQPGEGSSITIDLPA